MEKYIILEIIPTNLNPKIGEVAQLSAIKLDGFKIVDRFDYRLTQDKIKIADFEKLLSFDKENFVYKNSSIEIMTLAKEWCENYPLYIIDNAYTKQYINYYKMDNELVSVAEKLKLAESEYLIELLIDKYKLEPSNYIVDLIFEAIIAESNNHN